jgi:hypothetical protein
LFIILLSKKIIIHLSDFVLINLQTHCFNLIIAFGIAYSKKELEYKLLLASKIGSLGTLNGNLYITKNFNLFHEISTHSQKLFVHNKIEFL